MRERFEDIRGWSPSEVDKERSFGFVSMESLFMLGIPSSSLHWHVSLVHSWVLMRIPEKSLQWMWLEY